MGLQVYTGQLSCKSADGWKLTLLLGPDCGAIPDSMSSGKTHLEVPGEVRHWQHLLCPKGPIPALYPHLIVPWRNTKIRLLFRLFEAEGNIINVSEVRYELFCLIHRSKYVRWLWHWIFNNSNDRSFFVEDWFCRTISEEHIWSSAAGCMITAMAQNCTTSLQKSCLACCF